MTKNCEYEKLRIILEAGNYNTFSDAAGKYIHCSTEMTRSPSSVLYFNNGQQNYKGNNNYRGHYRGRGRGNRGGYNTNYNNRGNFRGNYRGNNRGRNNSNRIIDKIKITTTITMSEQSKLLVHHKMLQLRETK